MSELIQGRNHGLRPVAVIDIGSNSIRLVVYEGVQRSPTPMFQEKVMCGLGKYLSSTGRLNPNTLGLALSSLARFRELARICGVKESDFHPFATAAVRWAEDGPEFLAKAQDACGVPIRVIDNKEEAELAATGVLAGFRAPLGVVGDLGGGSLELIRIGPDGFHEPVSLPLGGLSLIDRTKGDRNRAVAIIDETLRPLDWLGECHGNTFYAVGGTFRALAKLHMRQSGHPLSAVHGYRLGAHKALQVTGRYANQSPAALSKLEGISSGREETIPLGALLLNVLIHRMQPSEVVMSALGVREGFIYRLMSEDERAKDPLIAACEEIAKRRSRSFEHAKELIAWTDGLFQSFTDGPVLSKESDEERRLRHAACLVSDISWRAHPDYRGEQSAALIAQSSLAGVDHPGRAFLCLCVYHRYERKIAGETMTKLATLIRGKCQERALIIGQTVRLAHTLSAGMAGVLPQTSLKIADGRLVLEIPKRLEALSGETLNRRLRTLAKELDMIGEVRVNAMAETPKSSFFRTLWSRSGEEML